MKKQRIVPLLAAIAGLVLAVGVSAFRHVGKDSHQKLNPVYYKFIGSDDNAADQIANWEVITETEYEALSCSDLHRPCALASSTTLTSVPFDQKTGYKDPKVAGNVTEVRNRSAN